MIGQLNIHNLDVYKKINFIIFNRVDVDKLYEDTPYIFEAGKELRMHTPASSEEDDLMLDELFANAPYIREASEGDGGIIKNQYAVIFPYSFELNLSSYLYSSELNITAKDYIRVAVYGEYESDNDENIDSYFDVNLLVDDISYGIYRFKTGKWGYSDWLDIPEGDLKLVLYNPNEQENGGIVGFGAIYTGD